MREVDQLDDAVDHRVAERNQRIDRAIGHSVYQDLQEERRVLICFWGKENGQDDHHRADEDPRTDGAGQGATRIPECCDQLPLSLRRIWRGLTPSRFYCRSATSRI